MCQLLLGNMSKQSLPQAERTPRWGKTRDIQLSPPARHQEPWAQSQRPANSGSGAETSTQPSQFTAQAECGADGNCLFLSRTVTTGEHPQLGGFSLGVWH